MTGKATGDVDLEALLMSNSFYSSSPAVALQNPDATTYNTANSSVISVTGHPGEVSGPKSEPFEDSTATDDTVTTVTSDVGGKTSFMKNSPSIKALEHILNEKSRSFNYNLNNMSIQSFQTANESFDRHKIDTIPENDDDNDDTLIEDTASKYVKMPHIIPKGAAMGASSAVESPVVALEKRVQRVSMLEEAEKYDAVQPSKTKNSPFTQPPKMAAAKPANPPPSAASASRETLPEPKSQTPKFPPTPTMDDDFIINTPVSRLSQSPRKSPHVRSNSAFSLNLKKNFNHKRSNTINDLSDLTAEKPEKKKFSFRALFKKSDKKLTSSASQPDLLSKNEQTKSPVKPKAKVSAKKDLPASPKPTSQPYTSASITLPSQSQNQYRAYSSTTDIHFIREVTEDYDDSYDDDNLLANPPMKHLNHNFGEEMKLEPSLFPMTPEVSKPVSLDPSSMPKFNTNNPFNTTADSSDLDTSNDIFGSPLKKNMDQLLGEALFPRSLNPQEVESIVSLERSRSMKSIRSNKRNSFINYDGSDENIILGNQIASPVSARTVSRSSSILKNGSRRVSYLNDSVDDNDNYNDNEDDNYTNLIEFTDYIDLDNLDFNTSPTLMNTFETPENLSGPSKHLYDGDIATNPPELRLNAQPVNLSQIPEYSDNLNRPVSMLPPPNVDSPQWGSNSSPIVISSSSSSIDEKPENVVQHIQGSENVPASTPRTPITENEQFESLLTPNLEAIPNKITESPRSPIEYRVPDTNRPISMSFKGLKAPAFTNNLMTRNVRASGSHQSFNISYDDSDFSSSQVGEGFGTDDDDDDFDDDTEDGEADVESAIDTYYDDKENHHRKYLGSLIRPPSFHNNKIPSISSTNSSPRSFNSIISRTFRKTSREGVSPNLNSPVISEKAGVRFSSRIILYETYNCEEYDRHPDTATCNQITPMLAQKIRDELNEVKASMPIHEDSRCYTHFF